MKTCSIRLGMGLMALVTFGGTMAQTFDAGSKGSYGAMNITTNVNLDVPPDGIFHCTTINIAQGATLRFNRNALNTPVYLLATSNVTILGVIDVSGKAATRNIPTGADGGPGGFDGGKPGTGSVAPGAGYGPGAGKPATGTANTTVAGAGSYALPGTSPASANNGTLYGSPLLIPLVGGSGGGGGVGSPGLGGSGGGGAILIGSNTRIEIRQGASVNARGGDNFDSNAGSGGAVRLVAPAVAGNGSVRVTGGQYNGGAGRIRVDTLQRGNLALVFDPASTTTIGSLMLIFPRPMPRLDIMEAAGTPIPEGNPTPVIINLPFGSDPNRTVTLQARDFNALVPISVVLTPESGSATTYQAEIDNRANNPARTVLNVAIPVNVQVTVNAWTR